MLVVGGEFVSRNPYGPERIEKGVDRTVSASGNRIFFISALDYSLECNGRTAVFGRFLAEFVADHDNRQFAPLGHATQQAQDFVRLARAKGLSESTVIIRHATRAAIGPFLTIFGLSLGGLLGGIFGSN